MLGSRAFCGELDLEDWRRRGVPDAMAAAGFDFDRLADARGADGSAPISSSTSSRARFSSRPASTSASSRRSPGMLGFRARFLGEANHAGTTPMDCAATRSPARRGRARAPGRGALPRRHDRQRRRDLGRARRLQRRPGRAELTIDVRSPTRPRASSGWSRSSARPRADRRRGGARLRAPRDAPQAPGRARPRAAGSRSRRPRGGGGRRRCASERRGHDAMVLAHHVPAGDALRPEPRRPQPHAGRVLLAEHCELGARVLARTVRHLVTGHDPSAAQAS